MVAADAEWARLLELEIALEPMSEPCRAIRKQIASLEPRHEHYRENVEALLHMISSMTPKPILDCRASFNTWDTPR